MSEVEAWLGRQAERQQRIVLLQDAFLANRFWGYAAYRLRLFLPRFSVETVLHLVRVFLLFHLFSRGEFVAAVALHAAADLTRSFWWGSLEVLRERVRALHRDGRSHRVSAEIGAWLGWSTRLSLLVLVFGAGATLGRFVLTGGSLGVVDLYLFSICLGVSLHLVAQTYHSGVFATRRIYRPLAAIVGVELVSFTAVLALWPWLGAWSLPTAGIVSGIVSAGLTFGYTGRMYRLFQIEPWTHARARDAHLPPRGSRGEWFGAGVANAIMRMDALLVLVLLASAGASPNAGPLFLFFFAVSPTVRAGADWARLFYFDLKRLDPQPFRTLHARFEDQVFRLSVVMGLLTWSVACLTASLVYQRTFAELYLLLVPFFLTRSLLAAAQVRAFTARAYGGLLASGAILAVGAGALVRYADEPGAGILLFSTTALAAAILLVLTRGRSPRWIRRAEVLWPTEWHAELDAVDTPVLLAAVRSARIPPADGNGARRGAPPPSLWLEEQIAARIAARLGNAGKVTFMAPDRVVWFEHAGRGAPRVDDVWLARELGGVVERIGDTKVRPTGRAALVAARGRGLLGAEFARSPRGPGPDLGRDDVVRLFEQLVPDGIVYDFERPAPPTLEAMPAPERRRLLADAIAFARDLGEPKGRSAREITALVGPDGLRLLFVMGPHTPAATRRRWRALVRRLNVDAVTRSATSRTGGRRFEVVAAPQRERTRFEVVGARA